MKISILFAVLLISMSAGAQKKKQDIALTDQQLQVMVDTIPTKDGKIFYDRIVYLDSSKRQADIYNDIRLWFVENFGSGKAVIQVDDIANGKLIAKGLYLYSFVTGINRHSGYTNFIINVIVKDGKFRYQVYQFQSEDSDRGLMGSESQGMHRTLVMDNCYEDYKAGKRVSYNRKNLERVVLCQYTIESTLSETMAKKVNNSNF